MKNSGVQLSIVLPTINEEENLRLLIPEIIESLKETELNDFEILVMDDGSSDNTEELISSINQESKFVKFISRSNPPSLPMAIWDGIDSSRYDYVLWMDADGSMPAEAVKSLVSILLDNPESVIIGSRFVDGGAYKGILELKKNQ